MRGRATAADLVGPNLPFFDSAVRHRDLNSVAPHGANGEIERVKHAQDDVGETDGLLELCGRAQVEFLSYAPLVG